uniref:Shufflon protein D n=1 Tax=Escherichia coli TaxID=562 RepID=A0A1U9XFM8_ECOLX|nr:hypothetical protein pLishui142-1_00039 [Escherichia coli]
MQKIRTGGSRIILRGQFATYDANRIVKCGFYDEYNFYGGTHRTDLSGKCSYIVVCQ